MGELKSSSQQELQSTNDSTTDSKPQNRSESDVDQTEKQARDSIPDGGLRAWLRVLGCFLILANTMGLQSSFGAFQQYYQENLLSSYSAFDIAWIGTIQIFCSASGGLISGPLFDMGYDKVTMLLGCFFAVLAYMMTSLSTTYWQIFLAHGVAGGLAGTFAFAPSLALVALSFERNKALAVGITTSGFAFGAVIYPIVFRRLQPTLGFPWTTRIMAFIALGCFCVAYPLVYWNTARRRSKVRNIFDLQAWKEPPYAIYCWAVFFMYAGYWPPFFYMTIFAARAIGTSLDLAFYIFAIANAGNVIARFTATLLADTFGIPEVLTAATAISTIIAFCWPAVNSSGGMIAWSIFWGYFSGVMSACFAAIVPRLSPSPDVVGTRMGMLNGLFGVGCLLSPPIAGALLSVEGNKYDERSTYLDMQMFVGACLAVATLLFIYPLMHVRRQRTQSC